MRTSSLLNKIGVVALIALAACGKRPGVRPAPVFPPECAILHGPEEVADTITIALFDKVEPGHAPRPHNAGERLLFNFLYETLITVNCLDEVQAGLAESWSSGVGGRRWTFELREGALFWDGTPVTARDVAESWLDVAVEPLTRYAGIDSAAANGDRVLHVYFNKRYRKVPRVFFSPAFAATKPTEDSQWPLGSGLYSVQVSGRESFEKTGRTILAHPAFDMEGPVYRFLETSKYDARDLLEGVIDVMVTADPAVIEYAADRPQLDTVALPWDRTYVLLSTSRVQELQRGGTVGTISLKFREGLARDAVRGDARGYVSPSWWDNLHNCGRLSAVVPGLPPFPRGAYSTADSRRVLYDSNDPIARDLAERIVALAATDPSVSLEAAEIFSVIPGLKRHASRMVAEGIKMRELASSLRDGNDFAYIISIPRRPPDPCFEARNLISRARWLATQEIDIRKAVIPLVDTRLHVIAHSGRVGLIVDGYGNTLFVDGKTQER